MSLGSIGSATPLSSDARWRNQCAAWWWARKKKACRCPEKLLRNELASARRRPSCYCSSRCSPFLVAVSAFPCSLPPCGSSAWPVRGCLACLGCVAARPSSADDTTNPGNAARRPTRRRGNRLMKDEQPSLVGGSRRPRRPAGRVPILGTGNYSFYSYSCPLTIFVRSAVNHAKVVRAQLPFSRHVSEGVARPCDPSDRGSARERSQGLRSPAGTPSRGQAGDGRAQRCGSEDVAPAAKLPVVPRSERRHRRSVSQSLGRP